MVSLEESMALISTITLTNCVPMALSTNGMEEVREMQNTDYTDLRVVVDLN